MAKIFGLNIPPGLETYYTDIIKLLTAFPDTPISTQGPQLPRALKSNTALRSLFVQWAPMFDAFDDARRLAWHSYWGGWPGSGFSSFVEVNAPRRRAGLDLLLDPPIDVWQLISDGTFASGNLNKWADGIIKRGWVVGAKNATHTGASSTAALKYDNTNYWDGRSFPQLGPGSGIWGAIGTDARIANKFIPPSTMSCKVVGFVLGAEGTNSGSVVVDLISGGANPTAGTLVATSSPVSFSDLLNFGPMAYFTFSAAHTLTSGSTYWFVLRLTNEPTTSPNYPIKTYLQYTGGSPDTAAEYWHTNTLSPQSWSHLTSLALLMRIADANFDSTPLQQFALTASHANYIFSFQVKLTRGKFQAVLNGVQIHLLGPGTYTLSYQIPDGPGDYRLLIYDADFGDNVLSLTPSYDCDAVVRNVSIQATTEAMEIPVIGAELCNNGDFSLGLAGWNVYNFDLDGAGVSATSGGFDNELWQDIQNFANWQTGSFRLAFNIGAGSGEVDAYIYDGENDIIYASGSWSGGDGDVYLDFDADFLSGGTYGDPQIIFFTENAWVVLSNISLKRTA